MTKSMCLTFLIAGPGRPDARVLLGRKRTGFGSGKVVGLGGHVEPGESVLDAAVRETWEESGFHVIPTEFEDAGVVTFRFPSHPAWDMRVGLFRTTRWSGHLTASPELDPEWHPVAAPPWAQMWDDSRIWLPHVLRGERIDAEITYDADDTRVAAVRLSAQ
ncbi:8-oxo-dGTP diphosphatase [Rudaeicoccus suwonensis]|uniref:8-oxo-dGTP diphosphatase n=1 Tax=Rudaeicoccus suwonensis TaxID=657409 RepID=UPI001FEC9210|nr:8-oxo-dGTP diphosphatase [Rudaeicoccus suwonensis]